MIFLMKDGTTKAYGLEVSNDKIHAKFVKHQNDVAAVLIENFTRLRSDTYILVEGKNFKSKFRPFDVTYSMCFLSEDDPIEEGNTTNRTIHIEDIETFYGTTSMLYSLNQCYKMSSILGFPRFPMLLSVTVKRGKEKRTWTSESSDKLNEFLAEFDMRCDTDSFLDASLPRSEMVEKGTYYVRYDRKSNMRRMDYYFSDRKAIIYMKNGYWAMDITRPAFVANKGGYDLMDSFYSQSILDHLDRVRRYVFNDEESGPFVGTCIVGTGLLYLSPFIIGEWYDEITSLEILYTAKYNNPEFGDNLPVDLSESHFSVMGTSVVECLYIALFIPQIMDLARFMYYEDPDRMSVEIIINKGFYKVAEIEFPKFRTTEGIVFDLFYNIAKIMQSHELRQIEE